ncbi:restriction endonuclease subunit S [Streptomyces tendae]|uniref:restriction endonuclease subunit S n=1 Tax=Streptomyces tendae TaxID=1932 RepID=UPI003715B2E7
MRWGSIPLKRIATLTAGGTPAVGDPAFWSVGDEGHAWVSISDMSSVDSVTKTARRISDDGLLSARIKLGNPGTILFSMYASLGHTAWLSVPAAWNQAILGLCPDSTVDARFLRYALVHLRPHLLEVARSNTQANLNAEQVGNLTIPYPSFQEQRRIAEFLDVETDRIDQTVTVQEAARAVLLERRNAGVLGAVTGASIKDRAPSTLAWADTLPSSWREVKLTHVARMGSGHTPSRNKPEWWVDCTIPWVTTGEVSQMRSDRLEVLEETREKISAIGLANSSATIHPQSTVVLCRTAASAGYSAVMGRNMATSQDIATWTCGPKLDPFFLLWCLRAMRRDLLERLAMGSTHKTIYMPDLQALRIPLPSICEQAQIVAEIRSMNAPVDSAIDTIDRQLTLLAERRQTLITTAVTGQIDVTTASGRSLHGGAAV